MARALELPLDVLIVRKIGHPGNPEYAVAAVDAAGHVLRGRERVSEAYLEAEARSGQAEALRRERAYRGDAPPLDLAGRTALIIDEVPLFFATQQFLLSRRILVPDNVSLVCTDGDPHFAWFRPPVTHIHWSSGLVIRQIVRWAANVARKKNTLRQTHTPAEFVEGGTIGPAGK